MKSCGQTIRISNSDASRPRRRGDRARLVEAAYDTELTSTRRTPLCGRSGHSITTQFCEAYKPVERVMFVLTSGRPFEVSTPNSHYHIAAPNIEHLKRACPLVIWRVHASRKRRDTLSRSLSPSGRTQDSRKRRASRRYPSDRTRIK